MKAITARVYRSGIAGDCSCGGISSRYDEVLVPCPDGFIDIDESKDLPPNLVEIRFREFYDCKFPYVVPYGANDGASRPMFGGTFVYTSDSRFMEMADCGGFPVPFHDRFEN